MGFSMYSFVPQAAVIAVSVTMLCLVIHAGEIHSSTQTQGYMHHLKHYLRLCGLEQERAFVGPIQDDVFHPGW